MLTSIFISYLLYQHAEQGRATRYVGDQDVLMSGMRTITVHAQAVQSRNSKCRGKRTIASAAGRSLAQVHSDPGREFPGKPEQADDTVGTFQRRPVYASRDLDPAPMVVGPQAA